MCGFFWGGGGCHIWPEIKSNRPKREASSLGQVRAAKRPNDISQILYLRVVNLKN